MTRFLIGALLLIGLVGCGADGEPIQPSMNTSLRVGTDGVSASTGVSLSKGPLSIGLAL